MWRNWQIDKDVEKRESLCTVGRLLIHAATMKNSMMVPQKIKSRTTIWSSNLISGYICKAKERDICTFMFIAALFTTAKIQKQTKCPAIDKWVKEYMECIYNGIFFSCEKGENPAILTIWMNLECIVLSKMSQIGKDKYCMVSLICRI